MRSLIGSGNAISWVKRVGRFAMKNHADIRGRVLSLKTQSFSLLRYYT